MEEVTTTTELPDLLKFPVAGQNNYTDLSNNVVEMDSNMAWVGLSLLITICWTVYITFYHSRIVGYFLTKLINRLSMKGAYFKIGSYAPLARMSERCNDNGMQFIILFQVHLI